MLYGLNDPLPLALGARLLREDELKVERKRFTERVAEMKRECEGFEPVKWVGELADDAVQLSDMNHEAAARAPDAYTFFTEPPHSSAIDRACFVVSDMHLRELEQLALSFAPRTLWFER
jgi:hypothetical protein